VVAVQDAGEAAMAAGTVVEDRSDFKRVLADNPGQSAIHRVNEARVVSCA